MAGEWTMVEVRLFAGLRQGRDKIIQMESESVHTIADIMERLDIPPSEVAIMLINGFHQKPEKAVADGDVVSLFPAVGGG